MHQIKLKRSYDDKEYGDGVRILVDRLWPRGLKKETLAHDEWIKNIAPSADLRQSFHKSNDFESFKSAYIKELDNNPDAEVFYEKIKHILADLHVTLLFSAKDTEHNNAVVLREWLLDKLQ
ncbi:DUF488 family protein [Aerococcaceae bacterium DSM 111176]|nr:DUF488 family protein [Aerococcaceae bacterium DSM 111176]